MHRVEQHAIVQRGMHNIVDLAVQKIVIQEFTPAGVNLEVLLLQRGGRCSVYIIQSDVVQSSSSLPLLLNTTTTCSNGHTPLRWPRYSGPTRPPALHFLHSRCALSDPIVTDAIEAAARVRPRVRVPRLPRPARLLLLPPLYLPYFELPFDCLFQFRFNIHTYIYTYKKIEMFHLHFKTIVCFLIILLRKIYYQAQKEIKKSMKKNLL